MRACRYGRIAAITLVRHRYFTWYYFVVSLTSPQPSFTCPSDEPETKTVLVALRVHIGVVIAVNHLK